MFNFLVWVNKFKSSKIKLFFYSDSINRNYLMISILNKKGLLSKWTIHIELVTLETISTRKYNVFND